MLWETLSAARDLGRLHDIASVLIRWGFGDVVRRLGMSHALERAGQVLHWRDAESLAELEPPERVVRAMEELGPTFVKLGQILATRVDLFTPEWTAAFETLQDEVPARPFSDLREQLIADLGAKPEEIFATIDETALAAASIAQVHHATLDDGSEVVVKIRHPGIEKKIEADLRLLNRLAEIAEKNIPELKRFHPNDVVRRFALSLRRELDLARECHNAERITKELEDLSDILIPRVYWQWTCERVNVQEYVRGISGRELVRDTSGDYDRRMIARIGADAILQMVLVNGFFHADPHLGNFIILPGNRVALVDFGMVGRLNDNRRDEIIDLLYALMKKDSEGVVDVLMLWVRGAHIDEETLRNEIDEFIDHYHGLTLKQLDFTSLLIDLMAILREHELRLPPDLALLFKTFISLEGVGRRLDPEFNIVDEATPFLERLVRARYSPSALLRHGAGDVSEFFGMLRDLPKDMHGLVKGLRRSGMQVHVDLTRLDHFGHQIDRSVSRLTIGIIIAALIVGTAIIGSAQEDGVFMGLPALGVLAFLGACVGGIWLLISIWSGRRE